MIVQDLSFSSLHLDFINDSLGDLSRKFKKQNSHLNIFHGESVKVLESLVKNYRIKNIIMYDETDFSFGKEVFKVGKCFLSPIFEKKVPKLIFVN